MNKPAFHQEFDRRLSVFKLAIFYAAHPRDAYVALRESLNEAADSDFSATSTSPRDTHR